jgi:hypothetical protein
MQILFLSNRPEILDETLGYFRAHMDWAREFVVISPRGRTLVAPDVRSIDEDELLAAGERSALAGLGHGPRNTMLRRAVLERAVLERGGLDEVVIMSDDDYRPIADVPLTDFVDQGRLHGYVSHDLATWRRAKTSYDHTQRYALAAMLLWGYPHLGYGSHMPQAIHRGVFGEANRSWDKLADGIDRLGSDRYGIDEWSLVNNWGRANHPELFWTPRSYRTLGWPQFPHQWRRSIRPDRIQFENFDPAMYAPGNLFEGIPTACDPAEDLSRALVKLERWLEHDYELDELRATSRRSPLTASMGRRAALAAVRPVATARRYLTLADREHADAQTGAGSGTLWGLDADLPAG